MKFKKPFTLKELAALTGAKAIGDTGFQVTGLNEIHCVVKGDLTFVDHPKYYKKALESNASAVLINKEVECPEGKVLLFCENPFEAYNNLSIQLTPLLPVLSSISESAKIGEGTIVQSGAVIGPEVIIGKNCIIHSNVVIQERCILGDRVIVQANSVIGSDAFYYKKENEVFTKMHSCGRVILHDDVEIGASCTIDRGVSSDTIIGQGSKFDNHVHIGHDTVVGKNCLFAAAVAVAGVVTIEDNVTLWGQVGINKDIVLAKGTVIYAQSGLGHSTEPNKAYFGSPASEAMAKMREISLLKRLPELFNKKEK